MKKDNLAIKNPGALIAVCLSALMFSLEISSVPVALSIIEEDLKGNFKDIQWIMNIYTIACCTVLMAAGLLADKYGRKKIYIYSGLIFCLSSLLCGSAQEMSTLIVSRFLQGFSGGAMFICAIANLSSQFPDASSRARAFSLWGIFVGIGLGFGPIIGSFLMQLWNWRWIFLIHVPLAIFNVFLGWRFLKESKDASAKQLDIGGILSFAFGIFGFTYLIIQGPAMGLESPYLLIIGLLSACSFAFFFWIEGKVNYPMFDFSVFKVRNFSGAIMGAIGMNFSFWPFIIYLPILFQVGFGYTVFVSGVCLLAYTLPTLLAPPLGEYLSLRYHARFVIPLGLFVIGLGFISMWIGCLFAHPGWQTLLPGMLISGFGIGLTNTPTTNTATGSVTADRSGMASGIDTSSRLLTLAINIALMGFILIYAINQKISILLPQELDEKALYVLAERLASGNFTGIPELQLSKEQIEAVVLQAFRPVLLYGGLGAWFLAACSYCLFRTKQGDLKA